MQRLLYNPWLSIIAAAVAWGSGTVLTKAALDSGMAPFAVMLGRYLFALAGLAAVLALGGGLRKPDRQATWRGAVVGAVNMALPPLFFTPAPRPLQRKSGVGDQRVESGTRSQEPDSREPRRVESGTKRSMVWETSCDGSEKAVIG